MTKSLFFKLLPSGNKVCPAIFLCCIISFGSFGQQNGFPAIIALNHQIGFIIDSTELKQNNLFSFLPQQGISFLVLSQKNVDDFQVVSVFQNGDKTTASYSKETVKSEWQKLNTPALDTAYISDYSAAKNLFPEAASFLVMDESFQGKPYSYESKGARKSGRLFVELGYKYVSMLDEIEINSFHFNTSVILNRIVISGIWSVGGSHKNKALNFLINNSGAVSYKFRELSLVGGWIVTKKKMFFAVSTGISQIKYRILVSQANSTNLFFNSYSETEVQKTFDYGIPICLDFSIPSNSAVGLSLKAQTTFVFGEKPCYGLGIGMRLGRAAKKSL